MPHFAVHVTESSNASPSHRHTFTVRGSYFFRSFGMTCLAIRRIRGRSYNSGSAPFAFYRYYVLTLNPVESISYRKA
jgi:hypothetical protein